MKLSENFTLSEFTRSGTARRMGIDNTPTAANIARIKLLVTHVLEPVRARFGKSIFISSGYRSVELNAYLGGAALSQHCAFNGAAADIDVPFNAEVFNFIKYNLSFDQLIWEYGDAVEPDWVHVSYVSKEANRGEILVIRR